MTYSIPLSLTSLHPRHQARCRRANIFNVHQVVSIPTNELAVLLALSIEETEEISHTVTAEIVPKCLRLGSGRKRGRKNIPAKHCPSDGRGSEYRIITDDEALNSALAGGIRTGMLTEIVGESSCGKSQLALQLAVHTALGSSEQEAGTVALMISEGDSQGSIAVRRMMEMAEHIARRRYHQTIHHPSPSESGTKRRRVEDGPSVSSPSSHSEQEAVEAAKQQVLGSVHLASIRDLDALEHVIEYTLPGLAHRLLEQQESYHAQVAGASQERPTCESSSLLSPSLIVPPPPPLRLVIVDNLPSLFYATHPTSMNAMVARSRALGSLSDGLKRIARIGSPLAVNGCRRDTNAERARARGAMKMEDGAREESEQDHLPKDAETEESEPQAQPGVDPDVVSDRSCPPRRRCSNDGGSSIVIINHVSDVFDRDLRALGEVASWSEGSTPSSAQKADRSGSQVRCGTGSRSLGVWEEGEGGEGEGGGGDGDGEPPLLYSHQSPLFSGLATSVRAAAFATSLVSTRAQDHYDTESDGQLLPPPCASSTLLGIDPDRLARIATTTMIPTGSFFPSPSSFEIQSQSQIAPVAEVESDPLISGAFPGAKQAALGHVWNNCINARIMLCRTGRRVEKRSSHLPYDDADADEEEEEEAATAKTTKSGLASTSSFPSSSRRKSPPFTSTSTSTPLLTATLIFAPYAASKEVFFEICAEGIRTLSPRQVGEKVLPVGVERERERLEEEEEEEEEEWEKEKREEEEGGGGGEGGGGAVHFRERGVSGKRGS